MEDYSTFGFGLFIIFALAINLFIIIAQWKIFEKADKPGWASLIPIYGSIVFFEIVGKPWWWLLLIIIPPISIIFIIWSINLLSISFGKEVGFTLGLIFLPFIFIPILGFGSAEYKGPAGLGFQNESYSDILDQE